MDELTEQAEHETRVLGRSLGLTRRQLLAATTGMAAAAAVGLAGGHTHAHASPGNGNGVLVPPGKRGIILYTVRDAIGRNPLTNPGLPSGFKNFAGTSCGATSWPRRPSKTWLGVCNW